MSLDWTTVTNDKLAGMAAIVKLALSIFSPHRGLVILIPVQFHLVLQLIQLMQLIIIVYTVVACIDRSLGAYI